VTTFGDDIDIPVVDPVTHDAYRDIRLVLMIGGNDLDAAAGDRAADLFRRHLRGDYRAWTITVGILAAHVGNDADPQHAIFGPRPARGREQQQAWQQQADGKGLDGMQRHAVPPGKSGWW
jgi:hypothetical protein